MQMTSRRPPRFPRCAPARRIAPLALVAVAASCSAADSLDPSDTWTGFDQPVVYDARATGLIRLSARHILGDQRLDLIMVARGDLTVKVLPGTAAGRFGTVVSLPIGSDTRDAVVGDVNGDGIADLIATGHFDNAFFVRRGLGGGEFAPQVAYALRNHGHLLVVANLNDDGFDDIVAVHHGSGQPIYATAYLGAANGAMRVAWEFGSDYFTARGVVAGDFNDDGKTDIAIAAADNRASVLVFRGLGTGAFEAPTILPSLASDPGSSDGTVAVATADLNRDGRDDLTVARWDVANALVVRLATPAGFSDPVLIPLPAPIDVGLGDVNGDGNVDAVAANLEHGTVSILLGKGNGTFAPAMTVTIGTQPAWLTVADFDDDGLADVAVADQDDHKIRVLRSRRG